jgi:two-component system LytT family response regulator
MADGSGYALLRALSPSQRPVAVVCVGTRDDEAVAAFELQATDFVLWPSAPERLRDALTRARQQVLQLALLRTADELQRLLSEAGGAGGVDLSALFAARPAVSSSGAAPSGAAAGQGGSGPDALRRRRSTGGPSTGTLIASAPWRMAARGADGRPLRGREASDEGVLDLSQEDGGRSGAEGRPLRVLVREGRRTRFVPLADVDWFEADGNYIKVHASGESYRTRGTITAIETALDPRQFVRIHRRIVVNMDRVREMSPLPGGDGLLVLGDGSTLRLSRTYRSRVR